MTVGELLDRCSSAELAEWMAVFREERRSPEAGGGENVSKIGELIVKIGADMTSLTKGLEDSQKKLQKFGDKAKAIGGAMTTAVTLPLLAAGAGQRETCFRHEVNRSIKLM